MTCAYTDAEEEWIRANYRRGTINDTLDAFEAEFGRRPTKQALFVKANKMGLRKDRHGEERYVTAQKTLRWSSPEFEREREWMLEHDRCQSVYETIDAFEAEFGVRLNRSQVSLFRSTYGTQKRNSHGGGRPNAPVGSERLGKDGYLMVKVREWPTVPQSKDNWRFKHHIAYEEAYGPIPEGHVVMFADRNTRNFDPANLVAVPRKWIGRLNSDHDWWDRESLECAVAQVRLKSAVVDAMNRPRPCGVCGKPFQPPENLRHHKTNTCPECLAKGRKSFEFHGSAGKAVCKVCGKEFERDKRNQKRCRACIAEKPKHDWKKHASVRGKEEQWIRR